jgi:hypothetical protein
MLYPELTRLVETGFLNPLRILFTPPGLHALLDKLEEHLPRHSPSRAQRTPLSSFIPSTSLRTKASIHGSLLCGATEEYSGWGKWTMGGMGALGVLACHWGRLRRVGESVYWAAGRVSLRNTTMKGDG